MACCEFQLLFNENVSQFSFPRNFLIKEKEALEKATSGGHHKEPWFQCNSATI